MNDSAIQQKLAAMFAANKDEVSIPKIYIDMTGGWETGAILDEILFWTLPKKNTGKTSLRVFRDGNLWLAVRRSEWWERKRLTERQADTAIGKLVTQGVVEKDVFLFDGKPTVHLRLITSKFAALYAEKLREFAAQEDDENLIRDISDLYTMMGFPTENVISNLQNGEMLNLQNGEIINNPIQPLNTTTISLKTDEEKPNHIVEANKKMDAHLAMANFPGAKREARIASIQSYLGETFHRNTETKEWLKFARHIDDRQQNFGEDVRVFVKWLFGQKGYDPQFWPVSKMMEFWPSAFAEKQEEDKEHWL